MRAADLTPGTMISRRCAIASVAGLAVSAALSAVPRPGAGHAQADQPLVPETDTYPTNFIATQDRTRLYFKDWGAGNPVLFSHGWPLSCDAWSDQMLSLSSGRLRTIAHDRRGHGRSDQPGTGNDMDTYADDLGAIIEQMNLKDVVLVGHSAGGGEVVRYVRRHGTSRVAKVVLISAIPPGLLRTSANPNGLPRAAFDDTRAKLLQDRAQFYRDIAAPFYGANRPGSRVSQGVLDAFWLMSMQCGLKNAYDCIEAFSETDFREDLKRIDVPTLFVHGSDDQFVPIGDTAILAARSVKRSTLKVYEGAPHGLPVTHKERLNADLLSFIRA